MKATRVPSADTHRTKRPGHDLARGMRLLLNLRESLGESRVRGITLADAKRRLVARLAPGASTPKKPARRR
jgi:hypothetical protein